MANQHPYLEDDVEIYNSAAHSGSGYTHTAHRPSYHYTETTHKPPINKPSYSPWTQIRPSASSIDPFSNRPEGGFDSIDYENNYQQTTSGIYNLGEGYPNSVDSSRYRGNRHPSFSSRLLHFFSFISILTLLAIFDEIRELFRNLFKEEVEDFYLKLVHPRKLDLRQK